MTSNEIADKFVDFFVANDHQRIEASTLIPRHDPTLLFINSGMAPLKNYFLGIATPPKPRLCNVQPCIRTTDIDDIGDRHHLSYFEMLGSWSIGDYYKEGAIELAYRLLVEVFAFDVERLYVTVFAGDDALNLPADEQSAKIWERLGIARERIVFLGMADNFWGPAGEFGPCGPCTEVFYDCGEQFGEPYRQGAEFDTSRRYVEIWNAGVFIELNKRQGGTFEPLPLKSVDTGSGLERMAMVINGVSDVYQTDDLLPILQLAKQHHDDQQNLRIITDHLRATTMILAEGVALANTGTGYVPRRMLRKCLAIALGAKDNCDEIIPLVETVIQTMQHRYPQIKQAESFIYGQYRKEIEEFQPVVRSGLKLLSSRLANLSSKTVSSKMIFELVATHGLPLEIIKAYLDRHGYVFDARQYQQEVDQHRAVSRAGQKNNTGVDDLLRAVQGIDKTVFVGYQQTMTEAQVILLLRDGERLSEVNDRDEFFLVVDSTPFYAEAGGQVGDCGTAQGGDARLRILDVQKKDDVFVHRAELIDGCLTMRDVLHLAIDNDRRLAIRRNHSVTHLLQSALREVVGQHVAQKGSYVDNHKFRFDFQHDCPVTAEQLQAIEQRVNDWIWQDLPRKTEILPYEQAVRRGALFMLGENYHEVVRTISFGEVSIELCGGTHVENTGEIGLMRIVNEASIAKGIRRIEGVTRQRALGSLQKDVALLRDVCELLTVGSDQLIERLTRLKSKKLQATSPSKVIAETQFTSGATTVTVVHLADADGKELKAIANKKLTDDNIAIVFAIDQKNNYRLAVTSNKHSAKTILNAFFEQVEGRGGGKDTFAQGGGKADRLTFEMVVASCKKALVHQQ